MDCCYLTRCYPAMRRALLWMACAVTETQRTLFESQSARITLSHPVGGALPHLRLVALPDEPLDKQTIEAVLQATDDLLDSGVRFQSSWDLRDCSVPPARVVGRCFRWAISRKAKLDELNRRMAVCMPDSPALLRVVRLVLKMFGPVCPVLVSESAAECEEFMRQ